MDRRGFLSNLAFATGAAFVDGETIKSIEGFSHKGGLSILQGFTDETTTQFTVDVPKCLDVHYHVFDSVTGKTFDPIKIETNSYGLSLYKVQKIVFKDLYLNNGFELIVQDDRKNVIDHRQFKTLDTSRTNIRIAIMSCMLDLNPHRNEMWKLVDAAEPELLFMLGDNVYGDVYGKIHGPRFLWMRYLTTRRSLKLYRRKKLIPAIAIWDDHDFGKNNSSGFYKHKEKSLQIFNSFYAQLPISPNYHRGPGVSSSFTAFGHKFIFLDSRYWRKMPNSFDKQGYLGDEQMAWLEGELQHNQNRTWIFQGSQFFGHFKSTSGTYESLSPNELAHFSKIVKAHDKETYFGSGDIHFTEVTRAPRSWLGFDTVEITSSSLHSIPRLKLESRPERIVGAAKENFVVLDITPDGSLLATGIGRGKKKHFEFDFSI
ncbi:MAG: alkaline phosphatase D family protein [Bdellovibrionales bacterium]|nr:alkaline phosphatase D family protein [Bdellovibrionales bacterium]